jgi:Family of unknown function (DUF6049)
MAGLALTLAGGTVARAAAPTVPPPSTAPGRSSSTSGTATPLSTLAIALTSMTPTVVTPTSVLTIKGTITNTGPVAVLNGTVRLLVHHSPLLSRALVADWGAGDISDVGGQIQDANADLTVDLPPGVSVAFTIKAQPGTLGLVMDYASIGITLEALGDDGTDLGTHRLGLLRTFLTWQARADYLPLKITWLMPLTGGPTSSTGGPPNAAVLAAAVAPETRLANVLAAIQAAPARAALSVAIDPSLVADLESRATAGAGSVGGQGSSTTSPTSGTTPTSSPTGGTALPHDAVATYLSAARTALAGRRLVQLPYGDPDLMSAADNNGESLLSAALAAASPAGATILGTAFDSKPVTDVAWPAGGWADAATIASARQLNDTTLVLAASSHPPTLPQTTPSALAPITSASNAVLYDDVLSALLTRTGNATSGVLTTQRFLAETLATVGERPGRSRIVLVAAPRSFNPNPAVVQQLFSALAAAPWIRPATLGQLRSGLGQDAVTERDTAPIPTAVRRAQLPATQIATVRDLRAQAAQLDQVIEGDTALAQTRVDALRLASASLRGHSGTAAARAKGLRAALTALGAKVHILPLSNLNFLTSDGNLTLSVANDLSQDVHNLRIEIQPGNGRLVVVKQPAAIAVDGQRRTTIKVHVHAVAGGLVPVTARIVTPSGLVMGKTVTVQVHVRPTDTWAFWVLGGAAGLVFVVGLWRTIRRGRSRPRLQAPEVDPL